MMRGLTVLILAVASPLSAGNGGKIAESDRTYLLDQLEQSKKAMLAGIQGLSDAQWRFKPAPAVWSVQECAEHIILSEEYIFGVSQKMLQSPAVARVENSNAEYDRTLVSKVQDRSQKGKAPEPLVPGQHFATPAEAAKEFTLRRDKTIAYVKATQDDLRVHVGPSPAGPIDAYQFLLLLSAHSARHTAQIREVESNENYPQTPAARSRFLVVCSMAQGRLDQITPQQMATVREHGAYMVSQAQKGVILWGGRTSDPAYPHGYLEIEVGSESEAKEYIANDPAVKAGIFRCTLEAFEQAFPLK